MGTYRIGNKALLIMLFVCVLLIAGYVSSTPPALVPAGAMGGGAQTDPFVDDQVGTSAPTTPSGTLGNHIYLPVLALNWGPPARGWITPEEGGVLSTGKPAVSLEVPPGAVAQATLLTLSKTPLTPPMDAADFGLGVEIVAQDEAGQPVTDLLKPATLTFHYDPEELVAGDPAGLSIYAQALDGTWSVLSSTLDAAAQTVQAETLHFSGFGLFGQPWRSPFYSSFDATAVDNAGNVYFIHRWPAAGDGVIWRQPPGSAADTGYHPHFYLYQLGGIDEASPWFGGYDLAVEPDTGVLYVRRDKHVFRIEADSDNFGHATWSRLYPPEGVTDTIVSQMRFSLYDGTLWVRVADAAGYTLELRQLNSETGTVLGSIPGHDPIYDFVVDARGRLFISTLNESARGYSEHKRDISLWNATTQTWTPVAEGFSYDYGIRQSMTVDAQGRLYVGNLSPSQITVIGGDTPTVQGVIPVPLRPTNLAYAAGQLVFADGQWLSSTPAGRRMALDGDLAGVMPLPSDSLSGQGAFVTLTGTLSTVPAHHSVWFGGQRLPLYEVDRGTLYFGPLAVDTPPGELVVHMGQATRDFGPIQTIEPGNKHTGECNLQVAVNEWVVWETGGWAWSKEAVTSTQGLFEPWHRRTSDFSDWLAYQFQEPGAYTFQVEYVNGTTQLCTVDVSYAGRSMATQWFQVDPASGGVFYNNGARMDIPPGALPGSTPYTLTLSTTDLTPPVADGLQPEDSLHFHHSFGFDPEPAQLLDSLRFSVLYDPGNPEDYPMPAFYDDALDPDIPYGYQMRTYSLVDHSLDVIPGYVSLHVPAGVYTATATTHAPLQAQSPTTGTAYSGMTLWASLNDLGGHLWYKLGMPNAKIEDSHFSILYNTRAGVTADKALAAHEGFSMAHTYFRTKGYEVPDWVIVTLDPDLDAEGATSGLGRLWHWKISLASWQVDEDLRSAAAHELFHIIQYENMALEARAEKWRWPWWMEGTAVWAETVTFPNSNSAPDWVKKGADFVTVGLDNYGSLSEEQAYAAVALISYLEQEHPGTVLQVLQEVNGFIPPHDALRNALADPGAFYEGFAQAFLHPQAEPFTNWDASKAFTTVTVTTSSSVVIGQNAPALSIRGVNVVAGTDPAVPISFSQADGSIVRVPDDANTVTFGWNPDGSTMPAIYGKYPEAGRPVARAETFLPAAPLKLVYVNRAVDGSVSPQVKLEVPTLDLVTPSSFDHSQPQTFQLQGGGFGTVTGQVWIGMAAYAPDSWSDTTINVTLPANSVGPGTVIIRVEHAAGVRSNPMSVTAN